MRQPSTPPLVLGGLLLAVLLAQAAALASLWPTYFVDDAGFFFRYAESLAQGHGYRFNASEPPVWGASAPLWPLVLAAGLRAGLEMETSVRLFSALLTLGAVGLLTATALRVSGVIAALAVGLFAALDFRFTFWAMSGMATPLAHLLIALGLFAIATRRHGVLLGAVAGLALVHKLDMIPFACLLLAGARIDGGRLPRSAIALATALGAAGYGFAWLHFGSVLPNSFLVKVYTSHAPVPIEWFAEMALVSGLRLPLVLLATVGSASAWRRQPGLVLCATGLILVHTIAYTAMRPAETWDWYGAPLQGPLCLMAAIGLDFVWAKALPQFVQGRNRVAATGLLFAAVAALGLWLEAPARYQARGSEAVEGCRVEAGRWVAEHTPLDWKVLSHFGNPLYYSHRFALDTTRLNRAVAPIERLEMFAIYRPEVVIELHTAEGYPQSTFRAVPGYRVAHMIARQTEFQSFYSVVMLRSDLARLRGER